MSVSSPLGARSRVLHAVSVMGTLVLLWLVLSGSLAPKLLVLGALSALLVCYLTLRMELIDPEEHPFNLRVRALLHFTGWLSVRVVLANLLVARTVLSPRLALHPRVLRVRCEQQGIGRAIHANSITLTPGTVTMAADGPWLRVHCLSEQDAQAAADGDTGRRVSTLAQGSR